MRHVLDASAMLAMLLDEPGADIVIDALPTACIESVNLAEVATVLARKGASLEYIRGVFDTVPLPVLVGDAALAIDAGLLWPVTRSAGSSLGDRYCLALARRLDAVMITADRRLAEIAPAVGVAAEMIR